MGTGTIQFIDESGSVITSATVSPGGSITLIAQVTNLRSDGTAVPVPNEKVSFSMVTAGNGGGVAVMNDRTASGGKATAFYTAGNNMDTDTVRVTTEGSRFTATITITKSGGIVGARISSLAASSTTVAADQTTVITAKVTDGNSNPMQGETVTFTLPVNESGASFSDAGVSVSSISVNTDASGNAVAIYKAGSTSSDTEVYDTVRGALTNGSSNAVVITRSAGTAKTGYNITVNADPTTVPAAAGGSSVIAANVTNNGANVSGVTVNFVSSGGSVSPSSRTTSGNGNAETTFTAGVGAAGNTAGVVTASITVDGNEYAASVVVSYK
jgi:hypothetical protein